MEERGGHCRSDYQCQGLSILLPVFLSIFCSCHCVCQSQLTSAPGPGVSSHVGLVLAVQLAVLRTVHVLAGDTLQHEVPDGIALLVVCTKYARLNQFLRATLDGAIFQSNY